MPSKKPAKSKSPGVVKVVEWSTEDQCYVGSAPPLIGRCCHGSDEAEVFRELSEIVNEWLEIHESEGMPLPPGLSGKTYSGKFQLRLGPELHQLLALRAAQSDRSINDLAVEAVRQTVM